MSYMEERFEDLKNKVKTMGDRMVDAFRNKFNKVTEKTSVLKNKGKVFIACGLVGISAFLTSCGATCVCNDPNCPTNDNKEPGKWEPDTEWVGDTGDIYIDPELTPDFVIPDNGNNSFVEDDVIIDEDVTIDEDVSIKDDDVVIKDDDVVVENNDGNQNNGQSQENVAGDKIIIEGVVYEIKIDGDGNTVYIGADGSIYNPNDNQQNQDQEQDNQVNPEEPGENPSLPGVDNELEFEDNQNNNTN